MTKEKNKFEEVINQLKLGIADKEDALDIVLSISEVLGEVIAYYHLQNGKAINRSLENILSGCIYIMFKKATLIDRGDISYHSHIYMLHEIHEFLRIFLDSEFDVKRKISQPVQPNALPIMLRKIVIGYLLSKNNTEEK